MLRLRRVWRKCWLEALEELEGVREAEASHLKGTVVVDYEPETVSIASLATVIEEQGFKVKV